MEITLKFNDIEEFFHQLPRFGALMNFSGQFVNIQKSPDDKPNVTLGDTELPEIEHPGPGVTRVHATASAPAVETGKKVEAALNAARAVADTGYAPEPELAAPEPEPPEPELAAPEPEEPPATAEDIRTLLGSLILAGRRDDVKTILRSFGTEKLSDLKPEHYTACAKKIKEVLGNG